MFWIFNMSRVASLEEEDEMNRIYPKMVGFDFLNAFLFTFLTSQGDYTTTEFKGENGYILWMIFFAVTFIIQITFLNMIIAIMGNTF